MFGGAAACVPARPSGRSVAHDVAPRWTSYGRLSWLADAAGSCGRPAALADASAPARGVHRSRRAAWAGPGPLFAVLALPCLAAGLLLALRRAG